VPQSGDAGPSDTLENRNNRAFECLLRGFWAVEWITSGDPNAQCNSAERRRIDQACLILLFIDATDPTPPP
jgi:hypothetical protein